MPWTCYEVFPLLKRIRYAADTLGTIKSEIRKCRTDMPDPIIEPLILGLLEWLAKSERTYEEVMDAWRTSCPRLTVWEDANDRGLVTSEQVNGRKLIRPSPSGRTLLERRIRRQ